MALKLISLSSRTAKNTELSASAQMPRSSPGRCRPRDPGARPRGPARKTGGWISTRSLPRGAQQRRTTPCRPAWPASAVSSVVGGIAGALPERRDVGAKDREPRHAGLQDGDAKALTSAGEEQQVAGRDRAAAPSAAPPSASWPPSPAVPTTSPAATVWPWLTAIPIYNEAGYIRSVLGEVRKYSPEILVINDGSTDDTEAVVRRYDSRFRYIKQANKGPAAARNTGAKKALGEYIAFLDHDDIWNERHLATLLDGFDKFPV